MEALVNTFKIDKILIHYNRYSNKQERSTYLSSGFGPVLLVDSFTGIVIKEKY